MAKQTIVAIAAVAAFVLAGIAYVALSDKSDAPPALLEVSQDAGPSEAVAGAADGVGEVSASAHTLPVAADAGQTDESSPVAETNTAATTDTAAETTEAPASIDTAAALVERSLGDADAPVKMVEYASLSCGHCATFHKMTFPKLKETFIDTGKVHFTFNDYPLNTPALEGAMIARCLPGDKYFNFIKFLFETQEEWAYSADFQKNLRQSAKLVGASDALIDGCLAAEPLRQGLLERMQKAATDHEIKSTPSFVVNGKVVRGAQDFEGLSVIINNELKESATAQ